MLQDEDSFQLAIYRKHSRKRVDLNRSSSLPATKSSPSSPVVSSNNTYELLNTATGRSSSSSSKKKRKRKNRTPLSTVSTPSAPASPFLPETDDIPHGSGNNKENEPEASKGHGDDKNTHDTSEPASPLSPSSTVAATTTTFTNMSFSFWDYLRDEITVSDFDSTQEIKRERITNFFGVPGAIEKVWRMEAASFEQCSDRSCFLCSIADGVRLCGLSGLLLVYFYDTPATVFRCLVSLFLPPKRKPESSCERSRQVCVCTLKNATNSHRPFGLTQYIDFHVFGRLRNAIS